MTRLGCVGEDVSLRQHYPMTTHSHNSCASHAALPRCPLRSRHTSSLFPQFLSTGDCTHWSPRTKTMAPTPTSPKTVMYTGHHLSLVASRIAQDNKKKEKGNRTQNQKEWLVGAPRCFNGLVKKKANTSWVGSISGQNVFAFPFLFYHQFPWCISLKITARPCPDRSALDFNGEEGSDVGGRWEEWREGVAVE